MSWFLSIAEEDSLVESLWGLSTPWAGNWVSVVPRAVGVNVTLLLLSRYATGNDSCLLCKRVSLFCTKA